MDDGKRVSVAGGRNVFYFLMSRHDNRHRASFPSMAAAIADAMATL